MFKDFLLQYNKISESCFMNCVNHLTDRDLSQDECRCVDMCTKKHVSVNHKVMQVYMEIQPLIVNKRIEEVNKQQAAIENVKKEELESQQKKELLERQNAIGNIEVKASDKEVASGVAKEVAIRTE